MWIDPNYKNRYYLGADKGLSKTHDHGEHFTLIDNLPIAQFYRINFDMRNPYYVYGGLQDNGSYATASFSRDNTPEQCVAAIRGQFDLGCDGVILHGASPTDLAPIIDEYRRTRPDGVFDDLPANPGGVSGS